MPTGDYPRFERSCTSLLKKHLTRGLFERLNRLATSNGFTLNRAIRSGLVNQDSAIGVYAGDAESYRLFAELFTPIIEDYHGVTVTAAQPLEPDIEAGAFDDFDWAGNYVVSTRIRVARNLAGFPLGPAISAVQRHHVADRIGLALAALEGDLAGTYYPLTGLTEADRSRLIDDHFLFRAGDRFMEAAGLNRDWPDDRGIFHNPDKTLLVWVNEEDQLRIIAMEQGGGLRSVFTRLTAAVEQIGRKVPYLYDERLGYLTSCPTNLGTALRASVHIRLPGLSSNAALMRPVIEQHHLQVRGTHGEHSTSEGGVLDISNRRRLGVSATACVRDLYRGVTALIALEQSLRD